MAQVDTGLGWSANSEYLIQLANYQIAEIPGGTGLAELPTCMTLEQGWTAGLTVGMDGDRYVKMCIYQTDISPMKVYYARGYNGEKWIIGSTTGIPYDVVKIFWYTAWGRWDGGDSVNNWQLITVDGVSYNYLAPAYGWTPDENIPVFNTLEDAIRAMNLPGYTFTKSNAGFAVACVVKWKTQNGTELTSPILISSNTNFVDMTTTASGYYVAKFNGLLSGVRFYMSFWDIPGSTSLVTTFPSLDLTDLGNIDLDRLFMTIISTNNAHVIIINAPDPYENEGAGSGEEGGDGEDTGDDDAGIEAGSDFPSAINTGFCRIFSPSESELRDLSNYLWSNSYDLAQVKKLFSNPMDSILGLSAVPIRLLGSSVSFSLGGVPITGMTLPLVQQQRYTYHMGTITIKERWGSYLDYDPYTKFSIFLPFIGMREIAADDIMGKTVSLVYDIDILTGMCVARLQADTNCLYEWGGNCAIQLPINSRNWDSVFSTAVSAVGGIMSAVTGGSAPLVAGSVASAALQTVSMKPRIDKSSTIGGAAGWLGQMTPYIIRTTPEAFIPADQNKFIGYPAYINVDLANVKGYNEVDSIHLENVTATGAELDEIETILKGGVIF